MKTIGHSNDIDDPLSFSELFWRAQVRASDHYARVFFGRFGAASQHLLSPAGIEIAFETTDAVDK